MMAVAVNHDSRAVVCRLQSMTAVAVEPRFACRGVPVAVYDGGGSGT